jgi:hypothetical protein
MLIHANKINESSISRPIARIARSMVQSKKRFCKKRRIVPAMM